MNTSYANRDNWWGMLVQAVAALSLVTALSSCTLTTETGTGRPQTGADRPTGSPPTATTTPAPSTRTLDRADVERLRRVMLPLLKGMNNQRNPSEVRVGIIDDPHINAASAGGGQFYVTTGLLQKANDEQLSGVMAHELAHDDLGHVAKAQALSTGLGIGIVILDQIIPGSGSITPIAGQLIARGYSRREEYAADRHAMTILGRAGRPPETMMSTLNWLLQTEGSSSGGFFATHPATTDRIEALRQER
ncbi:MAG: M48 family metallopeptidase [Candidatus Rokuibacteriota bacterium]